MTFLNNQVCISESSKCFFIVNFKCITYGFYWCAFEVRILTWTSCRSYCMESRFPQYGLLQCDLLWLCSRLPFHKHYTPSFFSHLEMCPDSGPSSTWSVHPALGNPLCQDQNLAAMQLFFYFQQSPQFHQLPAQSFHSLPFFCLRNFEHQNLGIGQHCTMS